MPHDDEPITDCTEKKFSPNRKLRKPASMFANCTTNVAMRSTPDAAKYTKPNCRTPTSGANKNLRQCSGGGRRTAPPISLVSTLNGWRRWSAKLAAQDRTSAKCANEATADTVASCSTIAIGPANSVDGFATVAIRRLATSMTTLKSSEL